MRTRCSTQIQSIEDTMEGSIYDELYSEILQAANVDLDRRSTTTQANDNGNESDPDGSWYDDDSSSKAFDMDREWRRRHDQFHTIGYRDGLIAGKEAAAQEGFNIGFKDSVLTGYNWGLVRGYSSAMASLPGGLKEKLVEKEETRSKFQQLHQSVQSISSTDALKLFYEDHKKKSLKQNEIDKPSPSVANQDDECPGGGVLDSYYIQLQSILHESPLVEGHLKI